MIFSSIGNMDDVKIYTLKDEEDELFYVGKTKKNNSKGVISKSKLSILYTNEKLKKRIGNKKIKIDVIEKPNVDWYKRKVVNLKKLKKEGHVLINSPYAFGYMDEYWKKQNKKSYWEGLKRDKFTLSRLSESKFKPIIQYDLNGNLIKKWDSIKEAASFYNDYCVTKGCGCSKLYSQLRRNYKKECYGYWWCYEEELLKYFKTIPKKLNLKLIYENLKKILNKNRKKVLSKTIYTRRKVLQYDLNGNYINKFNDLIEAAKETGITFKKISSVCRGSIVIADDFYFEYENIKHKKNSTIIAFNETEIKNFKNILELYPEFDVKEVIKANKRKTEYKGFYWKINNFKKKNKEIL